MICQLIAWACSEEWWDQKFADSKQITGNLLEATPDVVEAPVQEDDEFLILATDGLWWDGCPLQFDSVDIHHSQAQRLSDDMGFI